MTLYCRRIVFLGVILCLLIVLVLSMIVAMGFGSASLSFIAVADIIMTKLVGWSVSTVAWTVGQEHIIWQVRGPRVVLSALVGAGLALVGAALQAVTRNPLADPHLLGVNSGATLGAVIVILYLGEMIGFFTLPLAAFLGALLSMFLVVTIARHGHTMSSERLLLSGVAVSFILMAMANVFLFLGDHRAASSVIFWMLGGLGGARWSILAIPACCVGFGFVILLSLSRALNALMAGDMTATTLGVSPRKIRLVVFLISSLLTGVLVALSGSIGFVGLMLPHISRIFVGADHRRLLPVSMLLGAIFLIWMDVLARTIIAPEDLPIGVVTAAVGGLFFVILLRRRPVSLA